MLFIPNSMRLLPILLFLLFLLNACADAALEKSKAHENSINEIIDELSLSECIGQLTLVNSPGNQYDEAFLDEIRKGHIGAILNETNPEIIDVFQQVAINESKHGIPLLVGRDVIHGFKTIFPINLGQAASWNPELIELAAQISAKEANASGVNWTFGPMVDIARDPRWGRIAESFGEDPLLTSILGVSMLKGFQGDSLHSKSYLAACAKHFAAYGAVEGGRDYNTVSVPEFELQNVHFPPFRQLVKHGIASVMTAFNELNGVPASGNHYLLRQSLKENWQFQGFVVSDWASIKEQIQHGTAENEKQAALISLNAGLDMEMASSCYSDYLPLLVKEGKIDEEQIKDAARRVVWVKSKLGLFEKGSSRLSAFTYPVQEHMSVAKDLAIQSMVLLKNEDNTLPLSNRLQKIALIGPMAHDVYEQLGTWIFDGDTSLTITPYSAMKEYLGAHRVNYEKALPTTRSLDQSRFDIAKILAKASDAIVVIVGEESILSGEAHSRAYLGLPGAQEALIRELSRLNLPLVVVVMAGRPLILKNIEAYADAILYAWHPGTMGGPALVDLLFGQASPQGKLTITFPRAEGQIPIYYNHKNTGRPVNEKHHIQLEDIPVRSFQTSLPNTNHYLDIGSLPAYPFGFGLSYTRFEYDKISLRDSLIGMADTVVVMLSVKNVGDRAGVEIVQLYAKDTHASRTRPVMELLDFKRLALEPQEQVYVNFQIPATEFGFYLEDGRRTLEPGSFKLMLGTNSSDVHTTSFTLIP